MVRINIIKPKFLLDQHLIAEWNEIQMLLGTIVKYPKIKWQPKTYKLGKGHINFFKDKAEYLFKRLIEIEEEMATRGYNHEDVYIIIEHYKDLIPFHLKNDWCGPCIGEKEIIIERLLHKHSKKSYWYTYYNKELTVEEYKEILNKAL